MIGVIRSEIIRAGRRSIILSWAGLVVLFAVLVNFVMFSVVDPSGPGPGAAPGVSFPDASTLLSPDGIVAGLSAAASFFGVVTLAFWSLGTAGDYSSGLVRLVVAAEPRRWRVLLGKWLALAVLTALVCLLAVVATLVVAPVAAQAGGWTPDAWGTDLVGIVISAGSRLYLCLLIWGSIGMALSTLTRSAGVAIGVGVAYVLLVEPIVMAVATGAGNWLPGAVLSALAVGGNESISFGTAGVMGAVYVVAAVAVSFVIFERRDITD